MCHEAGYPFGDAVHPMDVRLTQLTAVGVDRQPPADLDRTVGDVVLGLTPCAEPQLLQLDQRERGPTVPLVGAPWFALSERNSPGSIIVNMTGKRFMNESMPYVEASHHMYGGQYGHGPGPGENIPAWLVFDQQYRPLHLRRTATGTTHSNEMAGIGRHRQGGHAR
jgi:hypothetical protein